MPIRTGTQYLESLKDDREVWLRGERVTDVTTHPALAGCAKALADIYDLQFDPAYADILTMESPTSGQPVSLGYLLLRSGDDLRRRRAMMDFLQRRCGGVAGRLNEYLSVILVGLYDVRSVVAQADPVFADNIAAYFEHCRENDLCVSHCFIDPDLNRSLPVGEFEYLKVVEERPDGIVVRGGKQVATLSPYSNELLTLTVGRPGISPEEVVYFAVPIATPGLQIICRQELAARYPEDHPLSAAWDEMDALVVFNDVFVPNERVFYRRQEHPEDQSLYLRLFINVVTLSSWHILARMAIKAEVFAGICAAITDYMGTSKQPNIQLALADIVVYAEMLKAALLAAESNPVPTTSGMVMPNPTQVNIGRIYGVERHPQILQMMRELCGAGILMAPGEFEMSNPAISENIRRFFIGNDAGGPDRFRMLKLAWDYASDSFGGRQLLFEMYNARSLTANKFGLANSYDMSPHIRLAKDLAGIS